MHYFAHLNCNTKQEARVIAMGAGCIVVVPKTQCAKSCQCCSMSQRTTCSCGFSLIWTHCEMGRRKVRTFSKSYYTEQYRRGGLGTPELVRFNLKLTWNILVWEKERKWKEALMTYPVNLFVDPRCLECGIRGTRKKTVRPDQFKLFHPLLSPLGLVELSHTSDLVA